MKILLEMVIAGAIEQRITLIDSTIDNEQDAVRAVEALSCFDSMMLSCGCFNDNDHIDLYLNGDSFGYAEIGDWEDLVTFLGGTL
ncbi:MAG: hypothetical protein JKY14_13610 [Paraglaciecola sp.]|nr:hypothetical protein [Paraglaciecola sp.]